MSLEDLLVQRADQYDAHGSFADKARVSQSIKAIVRSTGFYTYATPAQCEAVDMIAHKLARIVAGNPEHRDSWDDIAGYAELAAREIK